MLGLQIYFFISFNYILVQCLIPSLNVRKIDSKIIARKRQDTLDMCRLFNEETAKLDYRRHYQSPPKFIEPLRYKRFKREIESFVADSKKRDVKQKGNSATKAEDYQTRFTLSTPVAKDRHERADQIVEMIYANMDAKGETHSYKGPYKYYSTTGSPTDKSERKEKDSKNPSRRFDFAPGLLNAASSTEAPSQMHQPVYDDDSNIRFEYGIIPYFIDPKTYDSHLAEAIVSAFDYFEKATCIRLQRLREKPTDVNSLKNVLWLYITNPLGLKQCVHSNDVAEIQGVQMVVFGYNCMSVGDVAHEVMHVLGFAHEHTRPDRDRHVSVLWDNVKPGYRKFFEISDRQLVSGLPYDYASVMHYPSRAFSRNGQVTILAERGVKIGQRDGLSETDVEKIGLVYGKACVKRNRDYLVKTCPTAVKADTEPKTASREEIMEYFGDRLWPLGRVVYRFKDVMEFSTEEKENIAAVIRHIEKETCIRFVDMTSDLLNDSNEDGDEPHDGKPLKKDTNGTDPIRDDVIQEKDEGKKDNDNQVTGDGAADEGPSTIDHATDKPHEGVDEEAVPDHGVTLKSVEMADNKVASAKYDQAVDDGVPEIQEMDDEKTVTENQDGRADEAVKDKHEDKVKGEPEKDIDSMMIDLNAPITKADDTLLRHKKKGVKYAPMKKRPLQKKGNHQKSARRHISHVYVLKRSSKPGCQCPPPGKPTGNQVLTINADCFNSVNDLLHLFGHVLGLDHQHNMHDRDSFLHINWENLTPEVGKDLKQKLPAPASVGFPYDYQSVMHFPWLQIKDGRTNIMYPIWNDGWAMGHWQGLSYTDVRKLQMLYVVQCEKASNYPEAQS